MWQVENHYDHMHIDAGGGTSPTPGSALGAAGSLTDSFLQVKLVDWNAPSPIGIGALAVGGPGGIPFGPPDPQVANAMCQVLDRMNVSAKVRLAAWETAIVESGVKSLHWGDLDSQGAVPAAAVAGLGHGRRRSVTRTTRRRSSSARAKRIEHRYSDPGALAQAVQISGHGERYGQRAGQAAALNDKFCG